jgi:hypothetical protein
MYTYTYIYICMHIRIKIYINPCIGKKNSLTSNSESFGKAGRMSKSFSGYVSANDIHKLVGKYINIYIYIYINICMIRCLYMYAYMNICISTYIWIYGSCIYICMFLSFLLPSS